MFVALSLLAGWMFAAGVYLVLRRSLVKLVFGLVLMGHAANLALFTAGGVSGTRAPLLTPGDTALSSAAADPVPQALVLTAIVIGFAVVSFAAVLVKRVYQSTGTDDSVVIGRVTT